MADRDGDTVSALARWAARLDFADLPDAVVEQTKLLILDSVGCAIAALDEAEPRAFVGAVESQGGAAQASIIGFPAKTSAANAVLANGVLLRYLDLNDYFVGGGHPSDNIPVALAVGEWLDRSGRDVIAAIAAGYEIYARIKALLDDSGSWDNTSVSGFAAPAMAGRLLGLDATALAHAMALGGARGATPGVMRSGDISAAKYCANALIAQSGTICALLAHHGITGPLALLDHPKGLHLVYPKTAPRRQLTAPLAGDCAIMAAKIKAYPCVSTAQTLVAAALKMRKRLPDGAASIERIGIVMADAPFIRRQQDDPGRNDPQSREAADHSFPFLAAVALADGALSARQFDDERWRDPGIRDLMGRISMSTDTALIGNETTGFPCVLEVTTRGGAVHRESVLQVPGTAGHGLDHRAVIEKFDRITAATLDEAKRKAIRDLVLDLDRRVSISPLMTCLSACRADMQ